MQKLMKLVDFVYSTMCLLLVCICFLLKKYISTLLRDFNGYFPTKYKLSSLCLFFMLYVNYNVQCKSRPYAPNSFELMLLLLSPKIETFNLLFNWKIEVVEEQQKIMHLTVKLAAIRPIFMSLQISLLFLVLETLCNSNIFCSQICPWTSQFETYSNFGLGCTSWKWYSKYVLRWSQSFVYQYTSLWQWIFLPL